MKTKKRIQVEKNKVHDSLMIYIVFTKSKTFLNFYESSYLNVIVAKVFKSLKQFHMPKEPLKTKFNILGKECI